MNNSINVLFLNTEYKNGSDGSWFKRREKSNYNENSSKKNKSHKCVKIKSKIKKKYYKLKNILLNKN